MDSISYHVNSNNKSEETIIEPIVNYQWTKMPNGQTILQSIPSDSSNQSMISQSSPANTKDKNRPKVYENSHKFQVNKMIITEWGTGKICSIDDDARLCVVKIEGQEIPFSFDLLTSFLTIFCCILTKSTTQWASFKLNMGDTVESFKQKIAKLYFVHYSQIVMVHSGLKITTNSMNLSEIGLFEGDELLIIIKDPKEYNLYRYSEQRKINPTSKYNSISFTVNENITLTGINFFKNATCDVMYDLIISDITDPKQPNVILILKHLMIQSFILLK